MTNVAVLQDMFAAWLVAVVPVCLRAIAAGAGEPAPDCTIRRSGLAILVVAGGVFTREPAACSGQFGKQTIILQHRCGVIGFDRLHRRDACILRH